MSKPMTVTEMARLGGLARQAKLSTRERREMIKALSAAALAAATPEQLSARGRAGIKARWANATPEQRAEQGRKMAAGRAKKRAAGRKKAPKRRKTRAGKGISGG